MPTPEELQALHNWMREPDWADEFSLADIVNWMNRRPTGVTARLAADPHCIVASEARNKAQGE